MRTLLLCLVISGSVSWAATAPEVVTASRLFREGFDCERTGDYAGALAKFREAQALAPNFNNHYHSAACLEALGRPAEAVAAYRTYLTEGGSKIPKERVDSVRAKLQSLAAAATDLIAHEVASPAGPGSMGSSLVRGPDGAIYLSWLEPTGGDVWAMKFACYDASAARWSEAQTIAQGADWFINWADFPVLAVQKGRLTAAWFVNVAGGHGHHAELYRALHSSSIDGGVTWSPPQPVTRESDSVEFVALQPLADGRLLVAWLDGRARAQGQDRQTLCARILGADGPDTVVDPYVCDCCQLSFVPTTDGGALLAYRGRTKEEVRDMRLARFDGRTWAAPTALNADGWKIAACPVNGPRLTATDSTVAAVWFTAAGNTPRVQLKISQNQGETFGEAVRLDLGKPQGRVDCVVLPDGRVLVTWLEAKGSAPGGIYARVVARQGELSTPQLLAPATTARTSGFPRIALLLGSPAQLLLTYTYEGETTRVVSLRVVWN